MTAKTPPKSHDYLVFKRQDDLQHPYGVLLGLSPPLSPSSLIKELYHLSSLDLLPMVLHLLLL